MGQFGYMLPLTVSQGAGGWLAGTNEGILRKKKLELDEAQRQHIMAETEIAKTRLEEYKANANAAFILGDEFQIDDSKLQRPTTPAPAVPTTAPMKAPELAASLNRDAGLAGDPTQAATRAVEDVPLAPSLNAVPKGLMAMGKAKPVSSLPQKDINVSGEKMDAVLAIGNDDLKTMFANKAKELTMFNDRVFRTGAKRLYDKLVADGMSDMDARKAAGQAMLAPRMDLARQKMAVVVSDLDRIRTAIQIQENEQTIGDFFTKLPDANKGDANQVINNHQQLIETFQKIRAKIPGAPLISPNVGENGGYLVGKIKTEVVKLEDKDGKPIMDSSGKQATRAFSVIVPDGSGETIPVEITKMMMDPASNKYEIANAMDKWRGNILAREKEKNDMAFKLKDLAQKERDLNKTTESTEFYNEADSAVKLLQSGKPINVNDLGTAWAGLSTAHEAAILTAARNSTPGIQEGMLGIAEINKAAGDEGTAKRFASGHGLEFLGNKDPKGGETPLVHKLGDFWFRIKRVSDRAPLVADTPIVKKRQISITGRGSQSISTTKPSVAHRTDD